MFRRWFYFNCRVAALAAILMPLVSASGCALFRRDTWDINHYRDARAVDIDKRLDKNEPIVKNPF